MTSLYRVTDNGLQAARRHTLARESMIEDWVVENPTLLGVDALIIGRQVATGQGKYIDLLAMDQTGAVIIIELKKDRTSREVVAQVLDYASWITTLTTPQIHEIAGSFLGKSLVSAFRDKFGSATPEQLNSSHSMLIVASELDPASRRIVEYLSEHHGVAINTAFFSIFESDDQQWLTTDFLLDQDAVEERATRKTRAPWGGYYFVNAGLGNERSWEDMQRYGFISAGGGEFYSKRLKQLDVGNPVFVYDKGNGYIGYGIVKSVAQPADQFETVGGLLFNQNLDEPRIKRENQPDENAEWVVGIDWKITLPRDEAKWFKGGFANQNIVCKLRDIATVDFLLEEFGVKQCS